MGRRVTRTATSECSCDYCTESVLVEFPASQSEAPEPPQGWQWIALTVDTEAFGWSLLCPSCGHRVIELLSVLKGGA